MSVRKLLQALGGSALLACAGPGLAKDVELFDTDLDEESHPPNVLIMIDSSANWNSTLYKDSDGNKVTKKEEEHKAIHNVVSDSDRVVADDATPKLRIGLMQFAEGNKPRGGRVEEAVEGLDKSHSRDLRCMLYGKNDNGNCPIREGKEALTKTNNAPYALSMHELYLYFAGLDPDSGIQDGDHDDDAIADDDTYLSPQEADSCASNFAIVIGNGEPDSGEDDLAEDKLDALGGVLSDDPIDIEPSNFESNWSDEYGRYLSSHDVFDPDDDIKQNVITYVIDVFDTDKSLTRKEEAARAWLKSIAVNGDGRYVKASNAQEIEAAFDLIINEIKAVNDVFASTTLPVSVNVRGTNLNQVYMGVFRPDDQGRPRWQGNLKLYELNVDENTGDLFLADANGDRADNSVTGFIRDDAESYWTHDSDYWDFDPRGDPATASDLPDGPVVEKGAVHQRLRDEHDANGDHTWRNVYTCTGDCNSGAGLDQTPFNTSNSNVTDDLSDNVIEWVRGRDVNDADQDSDDTDARPSMHGDVLHSEPAVVNYGDQDGDGEPDIYTFYGANDGVFHAVRGGKSTGTTRDGGDGVGFGNEIWGFIPEEFFSDLKILYENTLDRDDDGVTDVEFGERPNFVDGAITVHKRDPDGDGIDPTDADDNGSDEVIIYLSMRRGGRFIYALDVTDVDDPELLWKRTHEDTGFGELGQTWSAPSVATIEDDSTSDGLRDVVIFGGGYDPADDDVKSGEHSQGRAIYVLDARTGDLIWRASPNSDADVTVSDMEYAIPSRVTAIDRDLDANGTVDRLYVGDLGGQVWRADINSGNPDDWTVHKLAHVPGSGADGDRKFFFSPDVVFTDSYDAILLGSGDRTHPFPDKQDEVANEFFMFKDTNQSASIQDSITTIQHGDLGDVDGDGPTDDGWFMSLNTHELVVGRAVTLSGTVFFNTLDLVDTSNSECVANLGIARNYMVDFKDGTATVENDDSEGLTAADRSTTVPGGGFAPAPTPVIVEIDGKKRQAVISGTQVQEAPGTELDQRQRSYWFRQND